MKEGMAMLGWYIKKLARRVFDKEIWAAIYEVLRVEWLGMDDNVPALWSKEGLYLGE